MQYSKAVAELVASPVHLDNALTHDSFRELFNTDTRSGLAATTVCGDGMNPTIRSGDTLFVDVSAPVTHYGIVIARIHGETTLQVRRYIPTDTGFVLAADNIQYEAFTQSRVAEIVGVVRAIITRYHIPMTRRAYHANN